MCQRAHFAVLGFQANVLEAFRPRGTGFRFGRCSLDVCGTLLRAGISSQVSVLEAFRPRGTDAHGASKRADQTAKGLFDPR